MKRQLSDIILGKRAALLMVFYAAVAAVSIYFAYEIRFDFAVPIETQQERLRVLWLVIPVKLLMLLLARQMGSMLSFFGVTDFFRLSGSLLGAAAVAFLLRFAGYGQYSPPRGVLLMDFLVCLSAFCSFRLGARLFRERFLVGKKMKGRVFERVVIIGAGDTGASLVGDLLNMPARGFRPVAFLDDDGGKHGRSIHGIPVEGLPEEFLDIPSLEGVRRAIIAMPSAPARRVGEIALFLGKAGVQVETVPAVEDLASGKARVTRIRPVEIQDLLGRVPVALDTKSIRGLVEKKVVMVTGAGGSIGSELCRQIVQLNPSRLLMLEQSEPSLFLIEQELNDLGYSGVVLPLVADVLDNKRIKALFATHSPQVIFHAAAHKHVFLMERQPSEAIKNNSVGTRKLAQVAIEYGAEAFVLISTDKAINPTSVMGASKRLAELHLLALSASMQSEDEAEATTQTAAAIVATLKEAVMKDGEKTLSPSAFSYESKDSGIEKGARCSKGGLNPKTKLMAVRFGNVLGSSGSVVPIFKRQIEAGGPVTVTHPDITRYFMTIPEAVGLVMQASVLGKGGEIFVLDMGQPVKILDLARQMIELSGFKVGEDIEIKFTGLKPGEKLYEELQHCDERHLTTDHPRIMRFMNGSNATRASCLAVAELEPFADELSPNDIKHNLKVVIPEYRPSLD